MSKTISIRGYSTALFATWYFVQEYNVLFDCGDGVCAALLQKARAVKDVFISHADRDHLTGLLKFLQLNGRPELRIHYPRDCGSFPALANFSSKFDPNSASTQWLPMSPGEEVAIRNDLVVQPIENSHVATDGRQIKSLSFIVESVRRKLKPEFVGLPGNELASIREQQGADAITTEFRSKELVYSGDTPIETDGRYQDAKILIHEATFLTAEELEPDNPTRNKHSSLDTVMEMVSDSNIGTLILGHFSSRYSDEQIDAAIAREMARCNIKIPVERVYPGRETTLRCKV
jgi:ribonuclease Z